MTHLALHYNGVNMGAMDALNVKNIIFLDNKHGEQVCTFIEVGFICCLFGLILQQLI